MNDRVSFRTIKDEIARRIGDKVWPPGTLIPGEAALADEFGAARATGESGPRALTAALVVGGAAAATRSTSPSSRTRPPRSGNSMTKAQPITCASRRRKRVAPSPAMAFATWWSAAWARTTSSGVAP